MVKESHSQYLNNVIGDSLTNNPKTFWSYVRTSKSEMIGIPPLRAGSNFCSTDRDKAEVLSSHFASTFTKESLPPQALTNPLINQFLNCKSLLMVLQIN
jgi:hypothetical protein